MNDIIAYDLQKIKGEHFLQTHSTNPLLKPRTIDHAVERFFELLDRGYDSLFTVNRIQKRLYDEQGQAVNHDPHNLLRTQDLPPLFEENSCLYLFSRKSFVSTNQRIGNRPFLFEIPIEESIDIDEEIDFRVAEFLYRSSNSH
jgi:CMP-N-acetylneuraminic acid synthetase